LLAPLALADLIWERSTRISGGTAFNRLRNLQTSGSIEAPIAVTIRIHGHFLARLQGKTEELFDLEKRTVTTLRHDRKTWSTVSFDEYRRAHAQPAVDGAQPDYSVDIRESGETRKLQDTNAPTATIRVTVDAADAEAKHKQPIELAAVVAYTDDDPKWAANAEAARKLSDELGVDLLTPDLAIALKPAAREALRRTTAETLKLTGGVLEEDLTIEGPASAVIDPKSLGKAAKKEAARMAGDEALSKIGHGLGSIFAGGAGGVASNGPAGSVPVPDKTPGPKIGGRSDQNEPQSNSPALLEVLVETTNYSTTDLPDAAFEIPAGYTQAP
jgi:hypothetical protein